MKQKPHSVLLFAMLSAFAMTGCASTTPLQAQLESEIHSPRTVPPAMVVGLGERPGVTNLGLETSLAPKSITVRADEDSDALPLLTVEEMKLSRATLEEALRFVLMGTGISLSIQPGLNGMDASGQGTASVVGLKGDLADVLEELSLSYGFHYTYNAKRNALRILPDKGYVMELPSVDLVADSLDATLQNLGATNVAYNKALGLISYRATKQASHSVESYLKKVTAEQSQLLYEVSIIEVRLNNNTQYGIQWNKLAWASGSSALSLSSTGAKLAGGLGLTGSFSVGNVAMDFLLSFLKTQGAVKVTNQPVMSMLSGGSSKMSVGNTMNYISTVATSAVGNSNTSQNSVTTSKLETGTKLELSGRYRDGTVYTAVNLKLSELLSMTSVSTGDNTVQLPLTSDREFSTPAIRIRPGESMLLGGIITERKTFNEEAPNVPFLSSLLASNRTQGVERTELVVVVRPTVIHFTHKAEQ